MIGIIIGIDWLSNDWRNIFHSSTDPYASHGRARWAGAVAQSPESAVAASPPGAPQRRRLSVRGLAARAGVGCG